MPEAPPRGRPVRRALRSALGAAATLLGIVAILFLATDASAGGAVRAVIIAFAIGCVFVPAAIAVASVWLRARNRHQEADAGAAPLSDRAVRAQQLLGRAAVRLAPDGRADVHARAALGDELRIAESTVRGLVPDELLGFLWLARPSQPDGFPSSPEFAGLPEHVQDMIVLLDLRREVQLRGAEAALRATSGVYHHDRSRTLAAARRTGNAALLAQIETPSPRTDELLAALDDAASWERLRIDSERA
ncbi:hypothetical protein [Microbacterium sp. Clip185]|uniref:hypothetical protein n=1 Tax=Microbacterium sp. Clip185 TaxID=3025663 RepID=UPI002366A288|nr:hypothetical protein [Microbacterium sp. Clip185]WDG17811.1 hypothetical protein PQV94_14460 [Microbacterium sp. Clip185]